MTGREIQQLALRRVWRRLAAAAGCSMLGQVVIVLLPWVIARAIDGGLDGGVAGWCALIVGLGAFSALLRTAEERTSWLAGADAVARVRAVVAGGVVQAPPSLERGEVVSRIHRDGDLLWEWLSGRVQMPGLVVGIVATLFSVTTVDAGLTLVAVVAVAGASAVALVFPRPFERRSAASAAAHGAFTRRLDVLVGGLVAVRGLGAETHVLAACREAAQEVETASRRMNRLGAGWRASAATVPMLGGTVGLVVGALGVVEGDIGVGGVVAFSSWMVLLSGYSVGLVGLHQGARMAAASAARLGELVPAVRPVTDGLAPLPGPLVAKGAVAEPGDLPLDLRVEPGHVAERRVGDPEHTAGILVGERAVAAGSVTLAGSAVAELAPATRASLLRRAPQHPVLVAGTIGENVSLGRTADVEEIRAACKAAGILDEIEARPDGLNTVLGDRGQGLSGGQRQRIGLARSVLGSPAVVVLDDALSALDARTEERVRAELAEAEPGVVLLSVRDPGR